MPSYWPTLKILSLVTANKLFFKDGLRGRNADKENLQAEAVDQQPV